MQSVESAPGGYLGSHRSPVGIGGAVAVHAAVIGIFLLMPREVIDRVLPPVLQTYAVPVAAPPPDPAPSEPVTARIRPQQPTPLPKERLSDPGPISSLPLSDEPITLPGGDGVPANMGVDVTIVPPAPVLVDAVPDPRYARDFQPPYPPAMQRQEEEGRVTVRLRIGADGRVLSVEKLSATDDAFWDATERQALRKWRFRPATRDGRPVESERVMTVRFRLS